MDFSEVPIKGLLLVKQFRSQHFKLALLQLQCLFLYCLTIFLTLDLSKESIGFPDAELYGESLYTKTYTSLLLSFTLVLLSIMRSQPTSIAWTVTSTASFCHCWSYTEYCVFNELDVLYIFDINKVCPPEIHELI